MRVGRFLAILVILDLALLAVYAILLFTVFAQPTYVPFASGSLSTLVPEGPHSSDRDDAWQRDFFGGKGNLVIRARRVSSAYLSDLVRRTKERAGREREARPDSGGIDLAELIKRAAIQDSVPADTLSAEGGPEQVITPGRTLIQLLASNTPNLRFTEDVPAFDSTVFCLGAVGRGQRWYRYLVQSGDIVVDLSMHSPHSSHIVYKEVLDKAFLNLRINGVASNAIAQQAVAEINGRISPRWAQGNIFWLIFLLALPTGIMLILLLVLKLSSGARAGGAKGAGPDLGMPSP